MHLGSRTGRDFFCHFLAEGFKWLRITRNISFSFTIYNRILQTNKYHRKYFGIFKEICFDSFERKVWNDWGSREMFPSLFPFIGSRSSRWRNGNIILRRIIYGGEMMLELAAGISSISKKNIIICRIIYNIKTMLVLA